MRLITRGKYDTLSVAHKRIMSIYYAACECNDEDAWADAYDAIFDGGYCRRVCACVPNFDWYDPDASYQEDVSAFVWAVEELMDNLKIIE